MVVFSLPFMWPMCRLQSELMQLMVSHDPDGSESLPAKAPPALCHLLFLLRQTCLHLPFLLDHACSPYTPVQSLIRAFRFPPADEW